MVLFILMEAASFLFFEPYLKSVMEQEQSSSLIRDARWLEANENGFRKPHPYFGYINEINNFEGDGVQRKRGDEAKIIVAIFGGSVAYSLFEYEKENRIIIKSSNKTVSEVINFSDGGYRQPQSLFISQIFYDRFDISVNVEGYNELTEIYQNYPQYYPMDNVSDLYYSGGENLLYFSDAYSAYRVRRKIIDRLKRRDYLLATQKVMNRLRFIWAGKKIVQIDKILNEQGAKFRSSSSNNLKLKQNRVSWLLSSCAQQNFLKNLNKKSIFFVQPVPWLYKKLTKNEREMIHAFTSKEDYKQIVSTMEQIDFEKLKNFGLNIVDLTKLFAADDREIYSDGYCHLTKIGQAELLESLRFHILKFIELAPSQTAYCDAIGLQRYLKEL